MSFHGKKRNLRGFSKLTSVKPHPYGLVQAGPLDPPILDLISTSPMRYSTIPILPCLYILAHPPWGKGGKIVLHTQTLLKSLLSLWRKGEVRGKDPLEGTLNTKA